MAFICFDAGGTAIKHGVFSTDGNLLEKGEYPTPLNTKEAFYQSIVQTVRGYEEAYTVEGIGMSVPGFINPNTGQAITAGALYALYGDNMVDALKKELDYPIVIENDANCAALAEMDSGHAQGKNDFLLITIGTGIGGAIVLNGELYRGNTYRAGEFGMMHVDIGKSRYATAHDLAATSSLVRFYKQAKGIPLEVTVDARTIMQEKQSDPQVEAVFHNWLDYLSTVIFNAATFFNPELILLGGGISADPTLIPALEEHLERDKDWKDMRCSIQNCKYYNEAGLRGAYKLAVEFVKTNHLV